VAPITKHRQAYNALKDKILDGSYGPGYRIVIDAVARDLGVSAVPVREAVRQLEAEGWVMYETNVGARVSPLDAVLWEDAMTTLAVLEARATALAAPFLGRSELAEAKRYNTEMRKAVKASDPLRYADLNRAFHRKLTGACPNNYLTSLTSETNDRLDAMRRSVLLFIPMRGPESIREHTEILALIGSHAPEDQIEVAARSHKLRTVDAFLDALKQPRRSVELA